MCCCGTILHKYEMKPILVCYSPDLMHTSTTQPIAKNIGLQACHYILSDLYDPENRLKGTFTPNVHGISR